MSSLKILNSIPFITPPSKDAVTILARSASAAIITGLFAQLAGQYLRGKPAPLISAAVFIITSYAAYRFESERAPDENNPDFRTATTIVAYLTENKPAGTLSNWNLVTKECYQFLSDLMRPYKATDLRTEGRRDLWNLVCKFDDADESKDSLFIKLSEYAMNRDIEWFDLLQDFSNKDLEQKFYMAVRAGACKVATALLKSGKIQASAFSSKQQNDCLTAAKVGLMTEVLQRHGFLTL